MKRKKYICLFVVLVIIPFYRRTSSQPSASQSLNTKKRIINPPVLSKTQSCAPVEIKKSEVQFYRQSANRLHQFEYRYEFNEHKSSNQSRLMILLTGRNRKCIDWWSFSTGEKTLAFMRSSGYSILAICTAKKSYSSSLPIAENKHVRWIYITLQKWMNDVYYKRFGHYPLLYLFGISRGSRISALLCRILPVQAQILYVAPGFSTLLLRSDHSRDIQNRLIADPTFANWFYFDYCSKVDLPPDSHCPFRHHHNKSYYHPVPPTHFVHAPRDSTNLLANYTKMMSDIRADAFDLGGALLVQNNSIRLSIATPLTVTADSMKDNFNKWSCKPEHSRLFYEHFVNSSTTDRRKRTCRCTETDFLYYIRYPKITASWSKTDQDRYNDYVKDVQRYREDLCETFCGDVLGYHQMLSQQVENTLRWIDEIDEERARYRIEDYLSRPLRL